MDTYFYITIADIKLRYIMIILNIPRKVNGRDLRDFILLQVKKLKKNIKHKYIKLRAEVAYSSDNVYFIFPNYALELAFALSLLFKCEKHQIPCQLDVSKPLDLEEIAEEIIEVARIWAERKLPRKYYRLRNISI